MPRDLFVLVEPRTIPNCYSIWQIGRRRNRSLMIYVNRYNVSARHSRNRSRHESCCVRRPSVGRLEWLGSYEKVRPFKKWIFSLVEKVFKLSGNVFPRTLNVIRFNHAGEKLPQVPAKVELCFLKLKQIAVGLRRVVGYSKLSLTGKGEKENVTGLK